MALINDKYDQWKSRLLDLSKRNRLLYFKEIKRGNVQLLEPSADLIFQTLVKNERRLTFYQSKQAQLSLDWDEPVNSNQVTPAANQLPALKPGDVRTKLGDQQLEATLYVIRSKARTALEEQGTNVLYLTFGMVKWFDASASTEEILSPLILVPVELDRSSVTKPYTLELADEDILVNPTLIHKLQNDFRLTLPAIPEDWESTELDDLFTQVRDALRGQPRWSVSPAVHLGLFSFEKLVMLKDLESHSQGVLTHPLILALAGDPTRLPALPADLPRAEDLDHVVTPEETFQILDADSSQQEAIARAKRGVSLVIQGPPGTGKSQTIANLIAEFLAQDKRVLFVSEKQAALDVVYKRLQECGLDKFCLKAHGHKSNRNEIVEQLRTAFDSSQIPGSPSTEPLRQLTVLRTQLNQYVAALHTEVTALGRTPFEVHGILASLEDGPSVNFSVPSPLATNSALFSQILDAIGNLAATHAAWEHYEDNPWRDTLLRKFSFQIKDDIAHHFTELIDSLTGIETRSQQLADLLGLRQPTTISEAESFLPIASTAVASPLPLPEWFDDAQRNNVRRVAAEAQVVFSEYSGTRTKFLGLYNQDVLGLDNVPEMISKFQSEYRGFLRNLNSNYRRDLRLIQAVAQVRHGIHYVEALTILQNVHYLSSTEKWIEASKETHQRLFGRFYAGLDTRWEDLNAALTWAETCKRQFGNSPLPTEFVEVISHQPQRLAETKGRVTDSQNTLARLQQELVFLGTIFPLDTFQVEGAPITHATFPALRQKIEFQVNCLDQLETWLHFREARMQLEQLGQGSFVTSALSARLQPGQLRTAFLKRFYYLWLDAVYEQNSVLRSSGEQRARLIDQFRENDRGQLGLARRRVASLLRTRRPDLTFSTARSSEVAILRREFARRRHRPVRKLFSEIPNLLLVLTPCLMMSPLSVSQFLSGSDFAFDAVIFDEASQVVPEDAIPSIMRTTQIIVAGDSQQLPPTSFFKSLGIDSVDADEELAEEVLESILQEATTFLPDASLKWHYRSRHESLIAFSNSHFYNNRLLTFPNAGVIGDELGIEFVQVLDGIYDRGHSRKNRAEARRVAELVLEHFEKFPERSLGVVAFSQAQSDAISEELERIRRENEKFDAFLNERGLEGFFVKNLENVQGDERDVMFFSVGYGKDANGTLTLNFGPLNGVNGARRLNVAVTRAREHIKLVSSILPEDIDLSRTNAQGVHLLRSYLEYARAGGAELSLRAEVHVTAQAEIESPFEQAVYDALTQLGLTLQKQVGCSGYRIDLAVVDPDQPGRYLLGIECDGATYHSAATARDRDRLRQQVLEGLGWRILRIWSRDWISGRPTQIKRVLDAVAAARVGQSSAGAKTDPFKSYASSAPKIDLPAPMQSRSTPAGREDPKLPYGVTIYKQATFPRMGTSYEFAREDNARIGALLKYLVNNEGPIQLSAACRRLASSWGMTRSLERVERRITMIARGLSLASEIEIRDDFLWPIRKRKILVRRPAPGESPRPINEIAPEEIAEAALLCLQNGFSLTREDLVVQTAHLLGFARTGKTERGCIERVFERLFKDNRIRNKNGKIELTR